MCVVIMSPKVAFSLWSALIVSAACSPDARGYPPDAADFTWDGRVNNIPTPYNLSATQSRQDTQVDGSYWAASFIHASNGHDYLINAHVMNIPSSQPGASIPPMYRSSIIDVTDPSYYVNYARYSNVSNLYSESGAFHAVFDGFGMTSTSDTDALEGIRAYSSTGGIEYDLTFDFFSPVLLNGGLGAFWVSGGLGYQWSLPKGRTRGWINIDGTKVQIVPEKSSTWYDRQWGYGSLDFQWFMIRLPGLRSDGSDDTIFSIWDWKDSVNGKKVFVTVRDGSLGRGFVTSASVSSSSTNTWTSPVSGFVYPQEWIITLPDGLELFVASIRPDQVTQTPASGIGTAFTGYVDIVAQRPGHPPIKGYGVVDVVYPPPQQ